MRARDAPTIYQPQYTSVVSDTFDVRLKYMHAHLFSTLAIKLDLPRFTTLDLNIYGSTNLLSIYNKNGGLQILNNRFSHYAHALVQN